MPEDAASAGGEAGSAGGPDLLVVDAANVVGSRPDGWWRDRAGAARRLVDAVARAADTLAGRVVVVLEGKARAGAPVADGPVQVVHAPGSGDDEITSVVAAAAESGEFASIIVVTSDRGLRERVERHGALTQGPGWLWRRLPSPP